MDEMVLLLWADKIFHTEVKLKQRACEGGVTCDSQSFSETVFELSEFMHMCHVKHSSMTRLSHLKAPRIIAVTDHSITCGYGFRHIRVPYLQTQHQTHNRIWYSGL